MSGDAVERARAVKLMIFDVDGVLTDGRIYLSDSGDEMKAFSTRDGQGMKLLQGNGVRLGLITARKSRVVERRALELGIDIVHQGISDKSSAFAEVLSGQRLHKSEVGYMGDDLADLPVLTRCGFAATVPAAPEALRSHVHYVTRAEGGNGAVREVCEFILTAHDGLERAIACYLR